MSKAKAEVHMEKLKQLATGFNHRFPEGDDAFQITTRLLEECEEPADYQ